MHCVGDALLAFEAQSATMDKRPRPITSCLNRRREETASALVVIAVSGHAGRGGNHLGGLDLANSRQAVSLSDQLSSRHDLDLELPVRRWVVPPARYRWLLDAQDVCQRLL